MLQDQDVIMIIRDPKQPQRWLHTLTVHAGAHGGDTFEHHCPVTYEERLVGNQVHLVPVDRTGREKPPATATVVASLRKQPAPRFITSMRHAKAAVLQELTRDIPPPPSLDQGVQRQRELGMRT